MNINRQEFAANETDRLLRLTNPVDVEHLPDPASVEANALYAHVAARAGIESARGATRRRRNSPVPRPRLALAIATAVLSAVVAVPAFGIDDRLSGLFDGESAPSDVREGIASVNEGAPPALDPRALPARTAKLLEATTTNGRTILWITPTREGGWCLATERTWVGPPVGTGCYPPALIARQDRIALQIQGPGEGDDVVLLSGYVGSPSAGYLELLFEDGSTERVGLDRGFFLHEVRAEHFAAGRRPAALIARTSDGAELVREEKLLGEWRRHNYYRHISR